MTKEEAANRLGVSVRALERYTQQSRIAARYEKGRTRPTIVYDEEEVDRFKVELAQVKHKPALERGAQAGHFGEKSPNAANFGNALAGFGEVAPEAAMSALVHFMQFARSVPALELPADGSSSSSSSSRSAHVPTADKTLLSLEEAGAITGLSRAFLKEAIASERLASRKIGRAWRIKRRDLDRFVDDL